MYKVIIIDDEHLARSVVKEYLAAHKDYECVAECNDGFEGVKMIQQQKPDLIFLDVQMPKINGFEMLELIDDPPGVIFTTAFDEFAMKAFDAHAVDYLLKPFSQERFDRAIEKWKEHKTSSKPSELLESVSQSSLQSQRVVVKTGSRIRIIPSHDIHFIEAADDYVKIHTSDGAHLKNKTMAFFEKTLDPSMFVRSHRSYIINLQQITRLDPYEKDGFVAVLKNGAKVPISKQGYTRLKSLLGI